MLVMAIFSVGHNFGLYVSRKDGLQQLHMIKGVKLSKVVSQALVIAFKAKVEFWSVIVYFSQ